MSKLDDAQKIGIINGDAPLMVKHLLWACSMFVGIIAFGVWFGLFIMKGQIKESVEPLQTKSSAKEYQKERKQEWNNWLDKDWKPHIQEANKVSRSMDVVLDRTDSKARNTNSVGRIDTPINVQPPNE